MLYSEPWNKFLATYRKATKDKFYISASVVLILVLYEIFLAIFATPNVVEYAGHDLWFKITNKIFRGTLPFSLILILYYGYILYAELNGIKTWMDKKSDGGKPKKNYKPNRHYPYFVIFEGFLYATLIYSILPYLTFFVLTVIFREVEMPEPVATNDAVSAFLTNPGQDFALALGGGVL